MRFVASSLLLFALSTITGIARADVGPTEEAMTTYFDGEVRGGFTLVGMGAAGLSIGAVLLTRDDDFARGAGYPVMAVGVVHAAAGVFVALASRARRSQFREQIREDEAGFRLAETKRMKGVRAQLTGLVIVESVLILGGAGLALYGHRSDRDTLAGVGVGLAGQAAATLVFDIVARNRAVRYLGELDDISVAPSVGPGAVMLVLSGSL